MFKLTLRELFLVVALVAMGCGWWVDRSGRALWQKRADSLKYHIERLNESRVNYGPTGILVQTEGKTVWYPSLVCPKGTP